MSADVRSIATVTDWHAALTTYGEVLGEAMTGVDLEIRRAFDWLDEQLARWKRAVRDCEEEVTRAKAELAQRKFTTWDGREPDCTVQEKALRLAKARLEHAEDKVETVRRWTARLPKLIDELFTGASRRLKNNLEADLPNALTELSRRVAALESYAGLRPDFAPGPAGGPSPSAGTSSGASVEPTSQAPLPAGRGETSARETDGAPETSTASGGSVSPLPAGRGAGGVGPRDARQITSAEPPAEETP